MNRGDARVHWENWSGSQRHRARLVTSRTLDEVVTAVREAAVAGLPLRCVGSGHSFVPLWGDGVILSMDGFDGVLSVDGPARRATIAAGTKLHALGPALWERGLSLPQQGDIDRQALAGALATGTHGTGRHLPNLSAYLRAVTLVTAGGDVVALTPDDGDRFSAAQISLGLLGVVVDVTLELLPAFHLHERVWESSVEECGARLEKLVTENRHFEFFWTPRDDRCEMKALNPADAELLVEAGEYVAPAYSVFPSERNIRFNEMEYCVPLEAGWDCFAELRELLLARFPWLPWPIEFRTLAADDALLSTTAGRDSVTLSVHQGAERDYRPLFDAAEAVFRNHGGRPHWGKLHSLGAVELGRLFPGHARFCEIRRDMDPKGLFLNEWLAARFGG